MPTIYVVGHVNPDTDSIASAVGYAWLLRERDDVRAVPARAGSLNKQTTWVLKRLQIKPPKLLTDASPRFAAVSRRMDTVTPAQPLRDAWAIANRTGGVAPVVNEDGTPYGLITGLSLFDFLGRLVGPRPQGEDQRICDFLARPAAEACDTSVPRFRADTHIRDALNRILREEHNFFLVVDEKGRYHGVCRQRDLLNPPRLQVILVDHNEPSQAIGALEEAELLEVLDHHRLGNPHTKAPIRFAVDVVGSTSTLVSERIAEAGLSAPPEIAGLLLAGLLSDTLILTSPTTTDRDHQAAERLARWAFIIGSPLEGETLQSFGEALLEAGAGLSSRDPDEVVSTDLKEYTAGGFHFGIAQAEVTSLVQLDEHLEAVQAALDRLRAQRGWDFVILMVTDVVRGSSRLVFSQPPEVLNDLPYPRLPDGTRMAEGVVSRKKQLLPVVLGLLE